MGVTHSYSPPSRVIVLMRSCCLVSGGQYKYGLISNHTLYYTHVWIWPMVACRSDSEAVQLSTSKSVITDLLAYNLRAFMEMDTDISVCD